MGDIREISAVFMRAYITVGLTILIGGAVWAGYGFLMTGFGPTFGIGVGAGIILTLSALWFGGLWTESARRREERRRQDANRLSPVKLH